MKVFTIACDVLPFPLSYDHYYIMLFWVADMVCIGSQSLKEGLSEH